MRTKKHNRTDLQEELNLSSSSISGSHSKKFFDDGLSDSGFQNVDEILDEAEGLE